MSIKSFSLQQFIRHAKRLDDPDDEVRFVQFMLTGKDIQDGQTTQAYIDLSRSVLSDDHPIEVARDFDSLIGVADDILVQSSISVCVAPNPHECLTTGIHLNYSATFTDENEEQVSSITT